MDLVEHYIKSRYPSTSIDGMSLAYALVMSMNRENGSDIYNPEDYALAGIKALDVKDVVFNESHLKRIQSRATPYTSGTAQIYGVVLYGQGKPRLIDGHHRLKGALEAGKQSQLNFIALVCAASNF